METDSHFIERGALAYHIINDHQIIRQSRKNLKIFYSPKISVLLFQKFSGQVIVMRKEMEVQRYIS